MSALRLWLLLRRGAAATSRLPEVLAVLAFAVSSGAMLVVLGGLHAMIVRWQAAPEDGAAQLYLWLAVVASGLMVIPILTLGGQAARLTLARRNERLAILRLCGATTAQTSVITMAETLVQAGLGALLGLGLYGLSLPLLTLIGFRGVRLSWAELWIGPGWLALGLLSVLVLALMSGLVCLAGVAVTPLGVANRVSPKRLRTVRVVIAGGMLVAWPVLFSYLPAAGLVLMALGTVAVVNLVGPWLLMAFGSAMAGAARTAPTLLAARRIVDDPRSAWRACSAFALVIMLATLSSFTTVLGTAGDDELPRDLSTGAVITMVIVSVVAATSSGVVHASRVIDQAPVYRSLTLAGTEVAVLDATRLREIVWPLAVTALTAGGFATLLLLPLSLQAPLALPRFAVAVLGSAALTVVALLASRPLLLRAARPVVHQELTSA